MRPGESVTIDGEPQSRVAVEQDLECHPGFESGQRRAQAVMDPVAEAEVRSIAPADVQDIGGWEPARIAVGRRQAHQHLFMCGYLHAVERHRLGRHPERGVRDRGGEPDELVDRGGKPCGIGQQGLELAGVIQQGHHSVADQAGRGVVAGDDELEQARQELLGGERVAFGGGDQDADQVVGRALALGVDQRAQVGNDAVLCLHGLRRRIPGPPGQQHLEPGVQARAVGRGDAKQFTDHSERQRVTVSLD